MENPYCTFSSPIPAVFTQKGPANGNSADWFISSQTMNNKASTDIIKLWDEIAQWKASEMRHFFKAWITLLALTIYNNSMPTDSLSHSLPPIHANNYCLIILFYFHIIFDNNYTFLITIVGGIIYAMKIFHDKNQNFMYASLSLSLSPQKRSQANSDSTFKLLINFIMQMDIL